MLQRSTDNPRPLMTCQLPHHGRPCKPRHRLLSDLQIVGQKSLAAAERGAVVARQGDVDEKQLKHDYAAGSQMAHLKTPNPDYVCVRKGFDTVNDHCLLANAFISGVE